MDGGGLALSRSSTPANSLHRATSNIDELTAALADFSRVGSPEPGFALSCCCGRADCENLASWQASKSRLEHRLVLSAEVGQALLQRHEAYVRQHEDRAKRQLPSETSDSDYQSSSQYEILELAREKATLEKRLNEALVNNEVTEISNKTILTELQEAKQTISRLTAHHARSVGWETRLSVAMRERDDLQQERDAESHRARQAESRLVAMKEKTEKLQSEIKRLQSALEERRVNRLELSDSILLEARKRLETWHQSQMEHNSSTVTDEAELTEVLESLVNDNEILKRDNAELQNLLTESREELHTLQEQVEEQRPYPPSRSGAGTPLRNIATGSASSLLLKEYTSHSRRSLSMERRSSRRFMPQEPLTPETSQIPLSPTGSSAPSEAKWMGFSPPPLNYASSHVSIDVESVDNDDPSLSPEKPKGHKTLLLLTRSRGVQTEPWPNAHSTSPLPSHKSASSPYDPRSESSSFSDSISSSLTSLLQSLSNLCNRMAQADALTLTNRLKRQHLKGADVGHLSRTTVNNIISEVTSLRAQYKFLLEDDKVTTTCTRKDYRIMFKLFKDIITEMGQMRITLNDVVLDPSIAPKVRELALHPSKVEEQAKERENTAGGVGSGWMAPLSKLFSPTRGESPAEHASPVRSPTSKDTSRSALRSVPKLRPELSASATTVNVEFSGTGVSRSTTSVAVPPRSRAAQSRGKADLVSATRATSTMVTSPTTASAGSPALSDIFVGAHRAAVVDRADPWVIVPKSSSSPRKANSFVKPSESHATLSSAGTVRQSLHALGGALHLGADVFSREVDAVVDVPAPKSPLAMLHHDHNSNRHREEGEEGADRESADRVGPMVQQRTLRRRGMSDSSIHSTFSSQAGEDAQGLLAVLPFVGSGQKAGAASSSSSSVFQALSKTMQSFRLATASASSAIVSSQPTSDGHAIVEDTPTKSHHQQQPPAASPQRSQPVRAARVANPGLSQFLPNLSSLAAAGTLLEAERTEPLFVGSFRDESLLQRPNRSGQTRHEFF